MDLNKEFEEAAIRAKQLPQQSNDVLLQLYSLYKQGTEGDINTERPGNPFDLVGNAKYNAWNDLKGTAKEDAQKKYIDLVNSLSGN